MSSASSKGFPPLASTCPTPQLHMRSLSPYLTLSFTPSFKPSFTPGFNNQSCTQIHTQFHTQSQTQLHALPLSPLPRKGAATAELE